MATTTKTEEKETAMPVAEKMVKVKVPREFKDQEDKVVWVNNKRYLIKRNTEVVVPESVALQLQHEEAMMEVILEFEESIGKGEH